MTKKDLLTRLEAKSSEELVDIIVSLVENRKENRSYLETRLFVPEEFNIDYEVEKAKSKLYMYIFGGGPSGQKYIRISQARGIVNDFEKLFGSANPEAVAEVYVFFIESCISYVHNYGTSKPSLDAAILSKLDKYIKLAWAYPQNKTKFQDRIENIYKKTRNMWIDHDVESMLAGASLIHIAG